MSAPAPGKEAKPDPQKAYIDLAERISAKLPAMIAIVVGLSFVVLMLASGRWSCRPRRRS